MRHPTTDGTSDIQPLAVALACSSTSCFSNLKKGSQLGGINPNHNSGALPGPVALKNANLDINQQPKEAIMKS